MPANVSGKTIPSVVILVCTFYLISYIDRKMFGITVKSSFEEFFSYSRRFLVTGLMYFFLLSIYPNFILPKSYPILTAILSLGLYVVARKISVYYFQKVFSKKNKISVAIYGAGLQGQLLLQKIQIDKGSNWFPVVIFDDNLELGINKLNGVKVELGLNLRTLIYKYNPNLIVVSFAKISSFKLQEIQELCDEFGVQFRIISPIKAITGKEFSISDIRKPTQEELIGKSSFIPEFNAIKPFISGKTVLITGAGGSIGSELARQIINFNPQKLFILDRDESALLEVSLTLQKSSNDDNVEILLADIRDEKRISDLLLSAKPEIVFHAAALKHLNILESHPEEAYKTNVLGTNSLLRASVNSNVKTFVNISTDKAVDPSSVLGKTKLIAEMLTAGFANKFSGKDARFLSVRFGNVFGSRGSVLHTFLKQIEQGGPITVTDPLVKRYFMTIEDAIHLLLKAATQGKNGETLILKMGEPISILDIAKKLVKSSGKTIEIKFTSLRPGEKLNESLVGINENLINSDLEGIFITKVKPLEWNDAPSNWKQLNEQL